MFDSRVLLLVLAAGCFVWSCTGQSNIAADFATLTQSLLGQSLPLPSAVVGGVAISSRSSFPFVHVSGRVAAAAGYYPSCSEADGCSSPARMVVLAHTGFATYANDYAYLKTLMQNTLLWAGKAEQPQEVRVGFMPSTFPYVALLEQNFQYLLFSTPAQLSEVDVVVLNAHTFDWKGQFDNMHHFVRRGGSLVMVATPWGLGASLRQAANRLSGLFGLHLLVAYHDYDTPSVFQSTPSPLYSAHSALDAIMARDRPLSKKDLEFAISSVDLVIAADRGSPMFLEAIKEIMLAPNAPEWFCPTVAQPFVRKTDQRKSLLLRLQWVLLDATEPSSFLFWFKEGIHPCAAQFPGLPSGPFAAARVAEATVTINTSTIPQQNNYLNIKERGWFLATGYYAPPGEMVAVEVSSQMENIGAKLEVGHHSINLIAATDTYRGFPVTQREFVITKTSLTIGSVFGGLIGIWLPWGLRQGEVTVQLKNVMEAPVFRSGIHTEKQWKEELRDKPAPWGFIATESTENCGNTPTFIAYATREELLQVESPQKVADHWQTVVKTLDYYTGYEPYRTRGDAATPDPRLSIKEALTYHYPMVPDTPSLVLNPGMQSRNCFLSLSSNMLLHWNSEWEIQPYSAFSKYILEQLIYQVVYRQSTYHPNTPFPNASDRIATRSGSTGSWWYTTGCALLVDFFLNLAEAFGWDLYRQAFGRLMHWRKGQTSDPALDAFDSNSVNAKRDRLFILLCDAAERDLKAYFLRYGLGHKDYPISEAVYSHIAAKQYPVWDGSSPPQSLSPQQILVAEDDIFSVVGKIGVVDADPGEIFDFFISEPTSPSIFSIDKVSGELTLHKRTNQLSNDLSLKVTAQGWSIPLTSAPTQPEIEQVILMQVQMQEYSSPVINAVSIRIFGDSLLRAADGKVDSISQAVISASPISSLEIMMGDEEQQFEFRPNGDLLLRGGELKCPFSRQLVVKATTSKGVVGYGKVEVVCWPAGTSTFNGLLERRWSGSDEEDPYSITAGAPYYQGYVFEFQSAKNVDENFTRMVTGYIKPPATGEYTLYVSANDLFWLYFSIDEKPEHKVLVGHISEGVPVDQFTTSEQGGIVSLEEGHYYYVEAIHIERNGDDHMAVAWKNATQAVHSLITGLDELALPSDEKGFFALDPPLVFPPPTISLSHPSAEEKYFEGEAVEARAEVQDNFNTILRAEFFHNGQLWSTLKERPYKLMTAGLPQGEHTFQVVAYVTGGPFHSDVTTITVQAPLPPDEDGESDVDSEDSEVDGDVDSEDSEDSEVDGDVDSEDSDVDSGDSEVDSSHYGSEEEDEEDSYSSFSSSEEGGKEEEELNPKVVIIAASAAGGGAVLVAAAAASTVGFFIWRRRNRLGRLLEIQLQPRRSVPSQREEDDAL